MEPSNERTELDAVTAKHVLYRGRRMLVINNVSREVDVNRPGFPRHF
jgi:hypothetical protein